MPRRLLRASVTSDVFGKISEYGVCKYFPCRFSSVMMLVVKQYQRREGNARVMIHDKFEVFKMLK